MIAQIRGQLIQKSPGFVIVEASGIGYQVYVSLNTFYDLPGEEQPVRVYTYTHVREDALQLYGFSTLLEKELFQLLIGVSGIGPKLALNILSGISAPLLLRSLSLGDLTRLLSIPGVGRKIAERMILDLKEKVRKFESLISIPLKGPRPPDEMAEDVISALVNLGYKKGQAEKAVESILKERPGVKLEEALKESLQVLSKS
ncbi:MAG: Holliday junction branch migration protein RuvA [Deltaproteobacteria bacterium]|nr:Holliday junction branch migration protein RuvA [Deltaproteobacteria bacterium]